MKRFLPLALLVLLLAWVASSALRTPPLVRGFDLDAVARLPILSNGRIKPLDTVSRVTLLQLQGKTTVTKPDQTRIGPEEWLLDLAFRPRLADDYRTFLIDDPEILALIGQTGDQLAIPHQGFAKILAAVDFIPAKYRRFSFNHLLPHLEAIDKHAQTAMAREAQARTRFQRSIVQLYQNLIVYQGVKYSLIPPGSERFLETLIGFPAQLPAAAHAAHARQEGKPYDEELLKAIASLHHQFEAMSQMGSLLTMPPLEGGRPEDWRKTGDALLQTFTTGNPHPAALTYAALASTWQEQDAPRFNELAERYRSDMAQRFPEEIAKADVENRFNGAEPFYKASLLFVLAFLLGLVSWLKWPETLGRAALATLDAAWIVTTLGIATRMWLEGRPPVTNLYSSALFVAWVAVFLCLVLERLFRNAICSVTGGAIGFCALIIAHNLSLSGDTLEMMRAVLDSNFWLATHVVTVTVGYGATFVAGFLGIVFVLRGVFTRGLSAATEQAISRMVYGIVCFATLFSLVGTLLGGIWADQSWGRFWGWDPKENGALIIVLWNAAILHARWGGLVRGPGLMAMAIFGNVVTAWSWFGTNMLGVGLHSYGFMEAGFQWLVGTVVLHLALIALALIPRHHWRSPGTTSGPA